jgi:uncharacterized protein YjeT (DUF2065 family)
MWDDFLTALALVLVIEGLIPFISPSRMRETLAMIQQLDDKILRYMGLGSMVLGVVLLYMVR